MAPDNGVHETGDGAADTAADHVRIDYLAGDIDLSVDAGLLDADRAELDDLRALLADPTLWAEPPDSLESSVVAAIAAEATAMPPLGGAGRTAGPGDDAPESTDPAPAPTDLAAARHRREQRSGRSGWNRPALLVAAAAAVIVLVAGTVLALRPGYRTFTAALEGTELAPSATGSVVMLKTDSGWEIKLNATGLPRLDNGRFYQGWLRNADGVLVPIGTFNEGTEVVLWAGVSPEAFPTLTVTQEQADGNQDSSGQRVLVGTAVEVK